MAYMLGKYLILINIQFYNLDTQVTVMVGCQRNV
jgi:hypothetical protein